MHTSPNNNCKTVEEKKQELAEMYRFGQINEREYVEFCLRADIEFALEQIENADYYRENRAF